MWIKALSGSYQAKNHIFCLLLSPWLFFLAFSSRGYSLAVHEVGDRVVVTINNVPFTQRQVEGYINIKESLRKNVEGKLRLVNASQWEDALTVFTNDAVFLIEAQRIGSVTIPENLAKKYIDLLREKSVTNPELKAMFLRLGLSDGSLERAVDTVLRVAAFRRSKERQESQSQLQTGEGADGGIRFSMWQKELLDRAIIRRYEDAAQYILIQPAAGG